MKRKKITALFMAALMASTTLAAYTPVFAEEEEEVVEEEEGEEAEEDEEDEEVTEINVALLSLSTIDSANSQHVLDRVNEILLEQANIQANITWYDATAYMTQVPMSIQAGEQLDVIMFTPMPSAGYASYMSQNQLMDITDYIDEYGEDIKSVMGDYLQATSKDGRIYGVGCNTPLYGMEGIAVRQDVLEETGQLEAFENMSSWSELKDILTVITENTDYSGVANSDAEGSTIQPQPFMNGSDSFDEDYWVDVLGDSYQYVYGDPETNEVKCYFYSEDYLESIKRAKEWYEDGLVYKDSATNQEYGDSLVKNGVTATKISVIESGYQGTMNASCGTEMVVKTLCPTKVATGTFRKFGFAVPVTAQEPEAAVKFINLLYGEDSTLIDTLSWGVEGVDWVKTEDGMADYPEGVTADTVQYHVGDFLYGNRLNVTPWTGEASNVRETQAEENENCELSPFFGFAVDSTPVATQLAACKNVVDQYKPQFGAGSVDDLDASYEEFKAALSAAGMDEILAEYQSQLDAWLAEQ